MLVLTSGAVVLQILPTTIDLVLELLNQVLIAGLEQVLKPSLCPEEVFDRKLLLWLIVQDPFALDHFEERPVAGLDCQLTDRHDVTGIVSPASRTWSHDIQKCRTRSIDRGFCFGMDILEVAKEGCLTDICYIMCGDDRSQILSALQLTIGLGADRGSRCICESWRCGRTLDTGIHVGTIVVADIYQIVSTLHRTG